MYAIGSALSYSPRKIPPTLAMKRILVRSPMINGLLFDCETANSSGFKAIFGVGEPLAPSSRLPLSRNRSRGRSALPGCAPTLQHPDRYDVPYGAAANHWHHSSEQRLSDITLRSVRRKYWVIGDDTHTAVYGGTTASLRRGWRSSTRRLETASNLSHRTVLRMVESKMVPAAPGLTVWVEKRSFGDVAAVQVARQTLPHWFSESAVPS